MINYSYLQELVENVPNKLDRSKKKTQILKEMRLIIKYRDIKCKICGNEQRDDSNGAPILQIHHIIPNGMANEKNLIVLCKYCHQTVHSLLYVSGKWRYVDVLKRMPWY